MLPHQGQKGRLGHSGQLGRLAEAQASGTDLLQQPEQAHFLGNFLRFPGAVLESLLRKVDLNCPNPGRRLSHSEIIAAIERV